VNYQGWPAVLDRFGKEHNADLWGRLDRILDMIMDCRALLRERGSGQAKNPESFHARNKKRFPTTLCPVDMNY